MPRLYKKPGTIAQPPGTLSAVEGAPKATITLIDYTPKDVHERELPSIEESFRYRDSDTVSWINIDGRDVDVIKKIDEHFRIHPLVLEDILNTGQRPKVEDYESYLFFVLKMIVFDEEKDDIAAEQIGLVLGSNFVITFQEKPGDVFGHIRKRIREAGGRIRQMGADYLAYSLLDAIVDHYFTVLEKIGGNIDGLEEELLRGGDGDIPMKIYRLKGKIIYLRKQVWPLREVIASLERGESDLIGGKTDVFLRDLYDHAVQVNETIEAFRDAVSGLHDIYLSTASNRMNEIMKVLTVFATIFIPLTFITGIYGMNFEYMPELHWRYAYFVLLGMMAAVGVALFAYFKKKRWM